jgi:hypothetical protein
VYGGLRLSPKDARDWIRGETPIPDGAITEPTTTTSARANLLA